MKASKHWLIPLFLIFASSSYAQVVDISAGAMTDALSKIESESEWLINYNPDLITSLQLTQSLQLDLREIEKALDLLLDGHSLAYSINEKVILIIPIAEKRYRICGTLHDKDTGEALDYVNVYVDNHQGAWSDGNGYFEFAEEIAADEKIHISYVGYSEMEIAAAAFRSGCPNLTMSTEVQDFPLEIIVRDYFLPSITQGEGYTGIEMDMSSMHRDMGAIERDVLKTIQFIPGITSLDETASNLTIRGSIPDQNLVLWEDAPMYNSGHLFGMISSINPFVIDDMKIYKGTYSPVYENRIGGILDIRLSDRPASDFHGAVGSTLTEAHGELTLPIIDDQLSLQLSGRQSMGSLIHDNPTLDSYGQKLFKSSEFFGNEQEDELMDQSESGLNYYDINAKVIYQPNDRLYWSSSFLNSQNTFNHAFNFGEGQPGGRDDLKTSSTIWANLMTYNWDKNKQSSIRVNLSNYESKYDFKFDESSQITSSILRSNSNKISDFQIKVNHHFKWNGIQIDGGYIYDKKDLSYSISEVSRFEEDIQSEADQLGQFHHLYVNGHWHKGKWLLDLGGRATLWGRDNSINLSPRFTLTRAVTDNWNVRFSGGLFNQYIRQLEQFNRSSINIENKIWVLATGALMTARKLSLGFNYQKNGWLIDFDSYYQFANGVPVLSTGIGSELEINTMGNTTSSGLELLIKRRWERWHSVLSYHLGNFTFNIPNFDDEQFPGNNDQRHNLSWINYYKHKSWSLGAQYQFHSGLPFSEIDNLNLIENNNDDYYEVKVSGLNNLRLSNFHRLDLYLGYQKWLSDKSRLDIQLALLNILDFKKTTSRSYVLSESVNSLEPEIFEVEKLQLGFTPQILMRLSF